MFLGHIKTNLSQQSSKRVTEEMCSWEDTNSKSDEKKYYLEFRNQFLGQKFERRSFAHENYQKL